MPETWQDLEQQLLQLLQEKKKGEDAIQETIKLLKKVGIRRRENPADKNKWGRTLDNLETTLSEKKRHLASTDTNILQLKRRIEQGDYSPDVPDEDNSDSTPVKTPSKIETPISLPKNLSLNDLKAAVKRILAIHILKLNEVSELDFKLATALISSRAAQNLTGSEVSELQKRLSIIRKKRDGIQRSGVLAQEAEPDIIEEPNAEAETVEKQNRHILQSVLQKCVEKKFGSISIEELEVLAKYGNLLGKQAESPKKSLLPIIQDSLQIIQKRISEISFE
jgi:hypothetical protein